MIPVITIDGPSGTGKGTIAGLLAKRLNWSCLDSGALYRVLGLAAQRAGIPFTAEDELARLTRNVRVELRGERVFLDGEDVSLAIRSEAAGSAASKVAAQAAVRAALLDWQRDLARPPGLVADGRDMGTVVFPNAVVKIFLTASPEERAVRRHKQLIEKGLDVSLPHLVQEIAERDERDSTREASPLRPADNAVVIDTTGVGIDEVLARVLSVVEHAVSRLGKQA
jgi:cytidylate kinase